MREQYMGREGRTIKEGDKVEITFYSYTECLSSVVGTVEGNYLNVESGAIPLGEIYCKEIRLMEGEDNE